MIYILNHKTHFMKKVFLAATFVVASFMGAYAQPAEGFQFGGGVRASLPIGKFSDSYSFGIGAELQGEYGVSDMISAVATTGYSSFFGKNIDMGGGVSYKPKATGYIPILVGARVYPSTNFFVGAQIGYGLFTTSGSSNGGFNYQPQVGYNAEAFQVALNYNGLSRSGGTTSHLGLTAIYKFGGN